MTKDKFENVERRRRSVGKEQKVIFIPYKKITYNFHIRWQNKKFKWKYNNHNNKVLKNILKPIERSFPFGLDGGVVVRHYTREVE